MFEEGIGWGRSKLSACVPSDSLLARMLPKMAWILYFHTVKALKRVARECQGLGWAISFPPPQPFRNTYLVLSSPL